jgi:hypothetical protein
MGVVAVERILIDSRSERIVAQSDRSTTRLAQGATAWQLVRHIEFRPTVVGMMMRDEGSAPLISGSTSCPPAPLPR